MWPRDTRVRAGGRVRIVVHAMAPVVPAVTPLLACAFDKPSMIA
jgi:hypothetical protein